MWYILVILADIYLVGVDCLSKLGWGWSVVVPPNLWLMVFAVVNGLMAENACRLILAWLNALASSLAELCYIALLWSTFLLMVAAGPMTTNGTRRYQPGRAFFGDL